MQCGGLHRRGMDIMTVNRRSRAVLTHLLAVLPQLPALIVEKRKETFGVDAAQRGAPLGEKF